MPMQRLLTLKQLLLVSLILLTNSCSKDVFFNEPIVEPNSTLNIRTRVGSEELANEGAKISYPINIYIFDNNNKCCDYVQIPEENGAEISLELLEGTYTICALAGANSPQYDMPTKDEATMNSVVALTGDSHNDLMYASNVVTLVEGGENTLTLSLERKVMLINSITMNNIPSTVKNVSVTVAPLYEDICLNGSYTGESGQQTVQLTKDGTTKSWKSSEGVYLLPASTDTKTTITVNLVSNDDQVKSYSYTCEDKLEPNYIVNIIGNYTERLGVELTGTLTGAMWDGEKEINFNFDEEGSSSSSNNEGSIGEDSDIDEQQPEVNEPAPQLGSFYKDKYYVLSVEPNTAGGTSVTLLMNIEKVGLEFDTSDQESIMQAVNSAILEMANGSGIDQWRLPTEAEIQYIDQNIGSIRAAIIAKNRDWDLSLDDFVYYLTNNNGTLSGWSFGRQDFNTTITTDMRLRPVATVIFK